MRAHYPLLRDGSIDEMVAVTQSDGDQDQSAQTGRTTHSCRRKPLRLSVERLIVIRAAERFAGTLKRQRRNAINRLQKTAMLFLG